jgi:urease accessory protein
MASPALPIGGFSYSGALEWGIESGQVHDEPSAREWLEDTIALSLSSFEAPLMVAALRLLHAHASRLDALSDPSQVAECSDIVDQLCRLNEDSLAARETRELRQESMQMGYSLGRWLVSVCAAGPADELLCTRLQPLGLPLAWALASWRMKLGEREAALGFVWSFAENQAMVLMKALPMGQVAAQRLLLALGPCIDAAVDRACRLMPEDWSNASPALALASMRHETQYSRLFRS